MDDAVRYAGALILKQRWRAKADECAQRLRTATSSLHERKLIEREQLIYETILHELTTRLGLPAE